MREQLEMEAKERAAARLRAARLRAARHRHVVEERRSWRVDEWRAEAVESGGCGQWRSWRVVVAECEEALGLSLWRHSLEDKQLGGVTFRLLLAWTIEHSKGKILAQKAGKGYKK